MGHQPRICPTYVSTIEIIFGYTIKLLNDVAANQIDSRKFDIKYDKTPPTIAGYAVHAWILWSF